ncbi:MAG TPA: hypothetical protein VFE96_04655 [Candidatus Bathyarchaeia archaeon]|nr:hypothetical protein [Candidatus Bathyarchaeia archaeon]
MSADLDSIEEARAILASAQEVRRDFGIKWIPVEVAFSDTYLMGDVTRPRTNPWYQDVPSDHPVMQGDTLVVAPSMKGRLSPAEWRPIVAASMIYYSKLNLKKNLGIMAIVLPIVLVVSAGILALLVSPNMVIPWNDVGLLLIGAYLGITLGSYMLVARYERDLWLKADRMAAEYVGPGVMLGILEKVDGFKISELEGSRGSTMPSLAQRIAMLRQYSGRTGFG